jgi:5-formaminoimidazole-4-carboxamide-1-beta-D-ribofuranosyl 5'-monophosphate synthetase
MSKYVVNLGITIEDKDYEVGAIVDESELPKKSLKWLKEQEIIVKAQRAKNDKGHFVADDKSTKKNEAWEKDK